MPNEIVLSNVMIAEFGPDLAVLVGCIYYFFDSWLPPTDEFSMFFCHTI